MRQLLKIYGKDYFLKGAYLYAMVWIFGILVKYTLNISSAHIHGILEFLFCFFYMALFIISYPLNKCLNWVLYTPLARSRIMAFNFIFQIYKIGLTFLFYSSLTLSKKIFLLPSEGKVPKIVPKEAWWEILMKSWWNGHFEIPLIRPEFSSINIFFTLTSLCFFLAFIFSISPHLIIEKEHAFNWSLGHNKDWKKYFKKNYKYFLINIFILILLRRLHGLWNSSLFLMSLSMSALIFFTIWSYVKRLYFPKKIMNLTHKGGVIFTLLIFSLAYHYSQYRLNLVDLSPSQRIVEMNFQGKFFGQIPNHIAKSLLESPLTADEINLFFSTYNQNHTQEEKEQMKQTLNFSQLIFSKNSPKALLYSLQLFKAQDLSSGDLYSLLFQAQIIRINQVKEKIDLENKIIEYLVDYPFTENDYLVLLDSDNPISQYIAVNLVPALLKKKILTKDLIIEKIVSNAKIFDTPTLFASAKVLSKIFCREITVQLILEFSQNKQSLRNKINRSISCYEGR